MADASIMGTIFALVVLAMAFQGLLMIIDTILDAVKVNEVLGAIPIVGSLLTPIWAYLFVAISNLNGGEEGFFGFGASAEALNLGRFGSDVATALVLVAFIPVKDAAISALKAGIGCRCKNGSDDS